MHTKVCVRLWFKHLFWLLEPETREIVCARPATSTTRWWLCVLASRSYGRIRKPGNPEVCPIVTQKSPISSGTTLRVRERSGWLFASTRVPPTSTRPWMCCNLPSWLRFDDVLFSFQKCISCLIWFLEFWLFALRFQQVQIERRLDANAPREFGLTPGKSFISLSIVHTKYVSQTYFLRSLSRLLKLWPLLRYIYRVI